MPALLHGYRRLRSVYRDGLLIRIANSTPGDGQRSLSTGLRLKCKRDHRALPGDSTRPRRASGRDQQSPSGFFFAVHQRYSLAILGEEPAI